MNLHTASAPYRRGGRDTVRVPVVMPLVEVIVGPTGHLTVNLDREPYSSEGTLHRGDLTAVVNDIANDLGTPVRVEVREADGSTFTDILTPPGPTSGEPPVAPPALASAFGISGSGFAAGEQVEVCVVVAHQVADTDGNAQLRLPPTLLADHPHVVLVGRTSGTIALSEGPA